MTAPALAPAAPALVALAPVALAYAVGKVPTRHLRHSARRPRQYSERLRDLLQQALCLFADGNGVATLQSGPSG